MPDETYSVAGLDLTLNPAFNKMAAEENREESSSESSSEKLPVRIVYDNELTDKDSITVFEFDFEFKADMSVSPGFEFTGFFFDFSKFRVFWFIFLNPDFCYISGSSAIASRLLYQKATFRN